MKTAKALGFKKGDFVLTEADFPAILVSDLHTKTPLAEVWGFEHELGGVLASSLRPISREEFQARCVSYGHSSISGYTAIAKNALVGLGILSI